MCRVGNDVHVHDATTNQVPVPTKQSEKVIVILQSNKYIWSIFIQDDIEWVFGIKETPASLAFEKFLMLLGGIRREFVTVMRNSMAVKIVDIARHLSDWS